MARLRRVWHLLLYCEGSLGLGPIHNSISRFLSQLKKPEIVFNRGHPRNAPRRGLDTHDLVDGRYVMPPSSSRLVSENLTTPIPSTLGGFDGVLSADRHFDVVPRVLRADARRRLQRRRVQGCAAACALVAKDGHPPGRPARCISRLNGRPRTLPLARPVCSWGQRPEAREPLAQERPYHRKVAHVDCHACLAGIPEHVLSELRVSFQRTMEGVSFKLSVDRAIVWPWHLRHRLR